jgi:tetratricopeptide (TPR) repeat protein
MMPPPKSLDEDKYFTLPDPSGGLAADLGKALEGLEFERGAARALLSSLSRPTRFLVQEVFNNEIELPSDLEDHFILRSKRFEAFVISGVHEDDGGRFIGLVVVALPMMGWELRRFLIEDDGADPVPRPDWAETWEKEVLEDISAMMQEEADHLSKYPRLYFPVLAEFVKDPFEEQEDDAYERRKRALVSAIGLLNQVMGFKVHSSESGIIPKEIQDQWIEQEVLDEHQQRMQAVVSSLEEDPKDARSWFEKAGLLMSRERHEEALESLTRTVELEPEFQPAWFAMADAFSALGREEDALRAEEEAKDIQRRRGTPQSRADLYFMLNPFDPRFEKGLPDDKETDGDERRQCDRCQNHFLDVKEDLWYFCNACGHQGSFEGSALVVDIGIEGEAPEGDSPIWLRVTLTNTTTHELTYTTDDIEVHMNYDGEDEGTAQYTFAPLQSPGAPASIEPHGKDSFKVDIRRLEWNEVTIKKNDLEEERAVPTFSPGTYNIDVFATVRVHAPWAEFKSTADSKVLSLDIKK